MPLRHQVSPQGMVFPNATLVVCPYGAGHNGRALVESVLYVPHVSECKAHQLWCSSQKRIYVVKLYTHFILLVH
jgi:hypothetical protein